MKSHHYIIPHNDTRFAFVFHTEPGCVFSFDLFKLFKDLDRHVAVYFSKHGMTVTGNRPNVEFGFENLR